MAMELLELAKQVKQQEGGPGQAGPATQVGYGTTKGQSEPDLGRSAGASLATDKINGQPYLGNKHT